MEEIKQTLLMARKKLITRMLDGIQSLQNEVGSMMGGVDGTYHNVVLAHYALRLAWYALEGNETAKIERDLQMVIEAAESWRESQKVKVA